MTDIAELHALRARIDQLEAQVASEQAARDEQRTTRRGMLRLAGAAAVGGLAATVAADPVAATDGSAVLAGVFGNTATLPTGIAASATSKAYGLACYETGLGALDGYVGRPAVFGHATNIAFNVGVAGHNAAVNGVGVVGADTAPDNSAIGVAGISTSGVGVRGAGGLAGVRGVGDGIGVDARASNGVGVMAKGTQGAVRLVTDEVGEPPTRDGFYDIAVLEIDDGGNVWYCFESGTPGKWRKLAGPSSAGTFHAIKPTRVYDSRAGGPGRISSGSNRLISVANGSDIGGPLNIVAVGATAVAGNITVTDTIGDFGYLAINPGGDLIEGASTINWFAARQTLANGVSLTLNASRELTVICNGGGSTHFIVDIAGYYR